MDKIGSYLMKQLKSIYKSIKKSFADAKAHEEFVAMQNRNRIIKKLYWRQYWFVALVLNEAVKANHSSLKIIECSEIVLLYSEDFISKNINEFWFVLEKSPQNTQMSDIPILPHEVIKKLEKYFKACRFTNFKIFCNEDTDNYYIFFRRLECFEFGHPLTSGMGEIFFNEKLFNPYTNMYGMYDIAFYNGGTCGGLKEGMKFFVYNNGIWSETGIDSEIPQFQKLTLTGNYVDNYVGWTARI